jgi:hypothetical protein
MWSANSGTPRSSWICLLLGYQGAPVTRWRHLDCNTCSLWMWVREAHLQAGHALSIMGWLSCLYSRTPFLMERSLLLFSRGPSSPSFERFPSWPDQCEVTRWTVYLGSPPDNELCQPIGLTPWRVLLVGAGWSAVWPVCWLLWCCLWHWCQFFIHSTTQCGALEWSMERERERAVVLRNGCWMWGDMWVSPHINY